MKIIVGLGNPGEEYALTRHNVGFIIINNLLKEVVIAKKKVLFNAECYETKYEKEKVIFVKPLTYMNLSGNAIQGILSYFKTPISELLIVYDDKDIALGKYKIKTQGSSAGHNGIKSIIQMLGTNNFPRIKIGIGSNNKIPLQNFVLGKFTKTQIILIQNLYHEKISKIIWAWINGESIEKLMSVYNA